MTSTYIEARDGARLKLQQDKVRQLMRDGNWRTLEEISLMTGAPPASASARLRQLRKEGYEVQREYVRRGLWKYRVTPKYDVYTIVFDSIEELNAAANAGMAMIMANICSDCAEASTPPADPAAPQL